MKQLYETVKVLRNLSKVCNIYIVNPKRLRFLQILRKTEPGGVSAWVKHQCSAWTCPCGLTPCTWAPSGWGGQPPLQPLRQWKHHESCFTHPNYYHYWSNTQTSKELKVTMIIDLAGVKILVPYSMEDFTVFYSVESLPLLSLKLCQILQNYTDPCQGSRLAALWDLLSADLMLPWTSPTITVTFMVGLVLPLLWLIDSYCSRTYVCVALGTLAARSAPNYIDIILNKTPFV